MNIVDNLKSQIRKGFPNINKTHIIKDSNSANRILAQKIAEAELKKSFTHIPLKPGETSRDNPFLAGQPNSPSSVTPNPDGTLKPTLPTHDQVAPSSECEQPSKQ